MAQQGAERCAHDSRLCIIIFAPSFRRHNDNFCGWLVHHTAATAVLSRKHRGDITYTTALVYSALEGLQHVDNAAFTHLGRLHFTRAAASDAPLGSDERHSCSHNHNRNIHSTTTDVHAALVHENTAQAIAVGRFAGRQGH